MEQVKKFYEALLSDKELQKKFIRLNEGFKPEIAWNGAAAFTAMIDFAKANGYDFTLAELEAYQKQPQSISDDELDAVSGGLFNRVLCDCFMIGGGEDSDENIICNCFFSGSGKENSAGQSLDCTTSLNGWVSM